MLFKPYYECNKDQRLTCWWIVSLHPSLWDQQISQVTFWTVKGPEDREKKEKGENRGKGEKNAFYLVFPLPVFRPTNLTNTEVPNMGLLFTCFGAWRPHRLTMSCLILPSPHPRTEDYCWSRDGWECIYLQLLSFPCSWELKGHTDLHPWGWRGWNRHAVWLRVSQSREVVTALRKYWYLILLTADVYSSGKWWCDDVDYYQVWGRWKLLGKSNWALGIWYFVIVTSRLWASEGSAHGLKKTSQWCTFWYLCCKISGKYRMGIL